MFNDTVRLRKGITPVVAIVMLLMLTVAVAGGAFAWINGIIGQGQEQATQTLNTDVSVKDIGCSDNGGAGTDDVVWFMRNSGQTDIAASEVTVYVYDVSSGDLMEARTLDTTTSPATPGTFDSGASWDTLSNPMTLNSADIQAGRSYRVEFEFTNQNSYSVEDTCQAS